MIDRKFLSRALTGSLLVALCTCMTDGAWALSLDKATVQSSLGQGLKAEVVVSTANDAEADSLTVGIAPAQVYAAGNLDVSPLLKNLTVSLQRQSGGNVVVRITGEQPVNEPVLQVLLDVRWSTGKMVRGFTLFIDPPAAPEKTKTETGSIVGAAPSVVLVPEKIPPVVATPGTESAAATTEATTKAAAEPLPQSNAAAVTRRSGLVQKGETARQIAARLRTDNLTAEQVMLALLRANPDAFIGQNINRLKAGAKLTLEPLPDPEALSATEAAREVARQAAAYAAWRKRVAAGPAGHGEAKSIGNSEGRSTSKKVGPAPEDTKPSGGQDELKLGAAKEKEKAEAEKLAAEMQAKEDSERKAELGKNIEALKEAAAKTSEAAGSVAPAAPAKEEPAAATPAPAVAAPVPAPAADAPWEPILQTLRALDSTILAGAAALVLLLGAWLVVRMRSSSASSGDDAPPSDPADGQTEEDAQPNLGSREPSLAAAFEQSTVDPQEPPAPLSPPSVLFSDSQLKPSDSLDAVAEADVYLAYGRDAQAEEILREALGVTPNKVELHQKLLDIFVLRGDAEGFADIAQTMSTYLDSQGPQWLKVCELGALLDGNNPLYHNHASPGSLDTSTSPSPGVRPLPMEFPAGLDLNLSKPADKPAASASQDFRPSTQIQPLGFEFSSQNLALTPDGKALLDTAQPWSTPADDEGSRLLDQKIELAKEFMAVNDSAGARILLNEVIERAQGGQLERAKQLLAQIA